MIPEQLINFRPYSEAETDRIMEAHFGQLEQSKKEELQKRAAERTAQMRPLPAVGSFRQESGTPHSSLSPQAQALKLRVLAAMAPKPWLSEVSSSRTQLELVETSPNGYKCVSAAQPPIQEPSHADTSAAPTATVAPDVRLFAAVPSAELDAAPSGLERFPVAYLADVSACDGPDRELAALCRELQIHKSYQSVRLRYCQLSIRMNLQGTIAPAFRFRPRVEAARGDPLHILLHRDQLVIDYHWCHVTRMQLSPLDDGHAHLLDLESEFDFAAAWSLTGKKQKRAYRSAEALCLTRLQQCQTMCLQSEETAALLASILDGYRKSSGKSHSSIAKVKAAIGQWIERDPRIKNHRISYERLWQAREMLGPGVPMQSIAELHGLMLGSQPLDRKTIAGKLSRLSKNVDITLKPVSTP